METGKRTGGKIQNAKAEIENLKTEAEQAEREWRLWKSCRDPVW
jgi:hypothetical protein